MTNNTRILLLMTLTAGCFSSKNDATDAADPGAAPESLLFSMNSLAAVSNNPPVKTIFTLGDSARITKIMTYHWNSGQGSPPGTLGLRDTQTEVIYGPWPAVASKSGYDVTPGATWPTTSTAPPYLYWSVQPNVNVPAGIYEVVDSDPATWSYTLDTGSRGITFVLGRLAHPVADAALGFDVSPKDVVSPSPDAGVDRAADAGVDRAAKDAVDSGALLAVDSGASLAVEAGGGWDSGGDSGLSRAGVTGTITTGTLTSLASQSIGSDGGIITVNVPDAAVNGLTLSVPAGAYPAPRTFSISTAPVTGHTFGSDFNPITPLITVDNGGVFSNEMMTVKIPVKVPPEKFAMGFYYDPTSKKLEGMATVSQDADSLTVATRHFSSFLLSAIDKTLLKKDLDTSFRPGIDDWQFPNYGSYLTSGHCTGQSMTAMWYYYQQPDGKDLTLYGRYDNNGNQPATPDLWQDDSRGYRFASVVWNEMDWYSWGRSLTEAFIADIDLDTWRLFAYSMQLTHQPQMTEIWDTKPKGGGHALVVYRILGGNLYVADPNYPGNTSRVIEYANEKFTPYNSADNEADIKAGRFTLYDRITYVAKDSLSDWSAITKHWAEVKDGTIGNDVFPAYKIVRTDDAGVSYDLVDGYVSENAQINLNVQVAGVTGGLNVFRDGKDLTPDAAGTYALNKGDNLLGFYVRAKVGTDWRYVDFKYLHVTHTPSTATVSIEGTWNPCATSPGLCNEWNFSGGSGKWIHGGFSSVDSMTNNFTYTLEGNVLTIHGLPGFDYGDDSPYTVTVTGTAMTWQSIEIASAKFTFKK